MWSEETKIKLFGINSTCRDWRRKKAEYEHHPHRQAWRWKHYALGLFLCQGYSTTPLHRGDYGCCHVTWNIGLEPHPHRQAWRWKHYALGLFLCQGYSTTPLHRGDYGCCHVTWNIGLEPHPLIPSY